MFSFIVRIFKFFWKTLTWFRIVLLNLFFLFIVVVIVQSIGSAPQLEIPKQSALFIAPSGSLVDQSTYSPSPIDLLTEQEDRPTETVIHDLIEAIHYARDDNQISGIVLRLDYMSGASISKIEEVGTAINYFKESGKPVVAFGDSMNQQQYLLASFADDIYINPMGSVYLTGFGVYRNYFKAATDKLSVKFHVFRVGEYKDAVEPFMRDSMSEPSKEHIGAWLTRLWGRYTGTIEHQRQLEQGTVDQLIAEMDKKLLDLNGNAAQLAINAGLVDDALSRIEIRDTLIKQFGTKNDDEINVISASAYLSNPTLARKAEQNNKVGLIFATGNIVDGHQSEGAIGSDSLAALIRKAREDEELNALVIRVDSGGGSAFASEVIRNELDKTKQAGLPIYISMGSVAASGGYWISTPANEIWATPTTLTGSIGVFGLIPNLKDSLEQIGVHSDGVGTSDLAGVYHINRELSPRAKSIIQSGVDNIYQQFIGLVADARNSTPDDVHTIAQGRVWSGEKAQELGLVDKLGYLDDVIKNAANQQDLGAFSVKHIKRDLSPREQFIRTLMEQASFKLPAISSAHSALHSLNSLTDDLNVSGELALLSQVTLQNHINPRLKTFAHCVECIAP